MKKEQSRKWQISKSKNNSEDKWERKKYLQECDSDTIKDAIKIRLHMWQVNCNYKRDNTDIKCPLCQKSEDTHSMCWNVKKLKSSHLVKKTVRKNGKRTEIYRKNKKKRKLAVIKVQD